MKGIVIKDKIVLKQSSWQVERDTDELICVLRASYRNNVSITPTNETRRLVDRSSIGTISFHQDEFPRAWRALKELKQETFLKYVFGALVKYIDAQVEMENFYAGQLTLEQVETTTIDEEVEELVNGEVVWKKIPHKLPKSELLLDEASNERESEALRNERLPYPLVRELMDNLIRRMDSISAADFKFEEL